MLPHYSPLKWRKLSACSQVFSRDESIWGSGARPVRARGSAWRCNAIDACRRRTVSASDWGRRWDIWLIGRRVCFANPEPWLLGSSAQSAIWAAAALCLCRFHQSGGRGHCGSLTRAFRGLTATTGAAGGGCGMGDLRSGQMREALRPSASFRNDDAGTFVGAADAGAGRAGGAFPGAGGRT
jgi:hypothetical protein